MSRGPGYDWWASGVAQSCTTDLASNEDGRYQMKFCLVRPSLSQVVSRYLHTYFCLLMRKYRGISTTASSSASDIN